MKQYKVNFYTIDVPVGEDINSLFRLREPGAITNLLDFKKVEAQTIGQSEMSINIQDYGVLDTSNPMEITYTTANAVYAIAGGLGESMNSMRVSLFIQNKNNILLDRGTKLDLYDDNDIEKESQKAAEKVGLRADLIETEVKIFARHLRQYRKSTSLKTPAKKITIVIPETTAKQCKEFLSKQNLMDEFYKAVEEAGIVGEERIKLLLFVIATSYKMPNPLHSIITGYSNLGKTNLLKTISSLIPKEDVKEYTLITESSLSNLGEYELDKKFIALEDRTGLRGDAEYLLRELQSNGKINSLKSKRNEDEYNSVERVVYAKCSTISCSTSGSFSDDDESRAFVVSVDASEEQTDKVIEYQDKLAEGLIDLNHQNKVREFIQNCIRLLNPYEVINPYAGKIKLPKDARNRRRLNHLYKSLIRQITLLHQFQRVKDGQGRLITNLRDIAIANELMFDAIAIKADPLGDSILRTFFEQLKAFVKNKGKKNFKDFQFRASEIWTGLKISKSKVSNHILDLLNAECIERVSGNAHSGYMYKIRFWDDNELFRKKIKDDLNRQLKELK